MHGNGVFTLAYTDVDTDKKMCCTDLYGGVNTNTDAIGFQTHCVGVGASVGISLICVGVGQCEHTIMGHLIKYKSKQAVHCSLCVKGHG